MNTWVQELIKQAQAGARRETVRRDVLLHYALMFEQQVALGWALADGVEFSGSLTDEATEARCLKAALLVQRLEQQGLDRERAMIRAALLTLNLDKEKEHGQ